MADADEGCAGETCLPSGRSIYDLITANNLDGIRLLLNPLTLRNRQSIVYQKVYNKTLLVRACELGFRDIVKYLLDECGADISERFTRNNKSVSALRVTLDKLDIAMLVVLVSRGIVSLNRHELVSSSHNAFNNGYCYLASILVYYSNRFEHTNFFPRELGEIISQEARMPFAFSWITDIILSDRSDDFLTAAVSGDIRTMRILLTDGINRSVTTESDDNALSAVILNNDRNTEHFLLNYKVFSVRDHVMALELAGAKFIAFRSNFEKGLHCWRKALQIRDENFLGVSDKRETRLDTDLGFEFQSGEQLDTMQSNEKDIYIQSLIVLRRLLSRFSRELQNAFMTVATSEVFEKDLLASIHVLAELFTFPSESSRRFRPPCQRAVDTMLYLLRNHFTTKSSVMADVLLKFRNLIDFMDEKVWKVVLRGAPRFFLVVYVHLLEHVIESITEMQKFDLSDEDKVWIKEKIGKILQCNYYPFPTTLLHWAIKGRHSLSVIKFILRCSADANCRDAQGNTPLHLAAEHSEDTAYLSSLFNLLVDAGGHIDSLDSYNTTPLKNLTSKGIIKHPVNFLSLQCLAAQTIHESDIVLPDLYPKILTRFIELHSTSKNYIHPNCLVF